MSKGKRRERQLSDLYERAGWRTYKPQESKWGETDMFGLFDVVAYKRTRRTHWVQVKSNRAQGVREWCGDARGFMGPHSRAYMAVCEDHSGWRVLAPRTDGTGHTTVVDERERDCEMGSGVVGWLTEGSA